MISIANFCYKHHPITMAKALAKTLEIDWNPKY